MRQTLTLAIIIVLRASLCAQQGITLNGPVTILPPAGGSNITYVDFSQASSLTGCPTLASQPDTVVPAPLRICTAGGVPYVDSGAGFVSLQGPKGDKGDAGVQGQQGVQGIQGVAGPAGAKGATGATGPQGKQGTWPTSFSCTVTAAPNHTQKFTNCK